MVGANTNRRQKEMKEKAIEYFKKQIEEYQENIKWYEKYIEQNNKRPSEYNIKANRNYRAKIENLKEAIGYINYAIKNIQSVEVPVQVQINKEDI